MQTESATVTTSMSQDITEHMPLVHRIVAHFIRRLPRSVQREDLVAAGTLGLFYALRASAHTCPEMFASYARIRIRGSIVDELRRHDWSPRRRKKSQASAPGTTASVTSIAPRSDEPSPSVARVTVVSFDDLPATSAWLTDESVSPLSDLLERRTHAALHAAIAQLPERERDILRMRYFQGMPSKTIAQTMGLSEARISQLHARATARLKELLGDDAQETKLAA